MAVVDKLVEEAEKISDEQIADVEAVDVSVGGQNDFFVTQALEAFLDRLTAGSASEGTGGTVPPVPSPAERLRGSTLYTCGPEPMMKRVAQIAAERGIECQIAVERAMACGMGTCQSCCIRVRKPDPAAPPLPGSDWCYRLACTDGPIFAAADLLW